LLLQFFQVRKKLCGFRKASDIISEVKPHKAPLSLSASGGENGADKTKNDSINKVGLKKVKRINIFKKRPCPEAISGNN